MSIFQSIVLVFGAGLTLAGWLRHRRQHSHSDIIVILGALISFILVVDVFFGKTDSDRVTKGVHAYDRIAGFVIGGHVGDTYPGSSAVLILPPEGYSERKGKSLLLGMQKGWVGNIRLQNTYRVAVNSTSRVERTGPVDRLPEIKTEDIDNLVLSKAKAVDIVILALDQPDDMDTSTLFTLATGQKYVTFSSSLAGLEEALRKEYVRAALVYHPDAVDEIPGMHLISANSARAFRKHFLMVTHENVGEIKEKYPQLF